MNLADLIETRRFLGSEFMMWLWFKSETHDGLMDVEDHGPVEVIYDDRLVLEAYLAETERNTLKGGAPAYSKEAKVALRQGKRVSRAKLKVVKDGREWTFTFKAEGMDYTSVKIPSVLSKEKEEKFYERMYLVEELEDIMATLYGQFLAIRLDEERWDETMVPAMRRWIESDRDADPEWYPNLAVDAGPIEVPAAEG